MASPKPVDDAALPFDDDEPALASVGVSTPEEEIAELRAEVEHAEAEAARIAEEEAEARFLIPITPDTLPPNSVPAPQEATVVPDPPTEGTLTPPADPDLRYVVWTVEQTAHLLDPKFRVLHTVCGLLPRSGGPGRLKQLLILDSFGNRKTCERCLRDHAARTDPKKAQPSAGRIINANVPK